MAYARSPKPHDLADGFPGGVQHEPAPLVACRPHALEQPEEDGAAPLALRRLPAHSLDLPVRPLALVAETRFGRLAASQEMYTEFSPRYVLPVFALYGRILPPGSQACCQGGHALLDLRDQ